MASSNMGLGCVRQIMYVCFLCSKHAFYEIVQRLFELYASLEVYCDDKSWIGCERVKLRCVSKCLIKPLKCRASWRIARHVIIHMRGSIIVLLYHYFDFGVLLFRSQPTSGHSLQLGPLVLCAGVSAVAGYFGSGVSICKLDVFGISSKVRFDCVVLKLWIILSEQVL